MLIISGEEANAAYEQKYNSQTSWPWRCPPSGRAGPRSPAPWTCELSQLQHRWTLTLPAASTHTHAWTHLDLPFNRRLSHQSDVISSNVRPGSWAARSLSCSARCSSGDRAWAEHQPARPWCASDLSSDASPVPRPCGSPGETNHWINYVGVVLHETLMWVY